MVNYTLRPGVKTNTRMSINLRVFSLEHEEFVLGLKADEQIVIIVIMMI